MHACNVWQRRTVKKRSLRFFGDNCYANVVLLGTSHAGTSLERRTAVSNIQLLRSTWYVPYIYTLYRHTALFLNIGAVCSHEATEQTEGADKKYAHTVARSSGDNRSGLTARRSTVRKPCFSDAMRCCAMLCDAVRCCTVLCAGVRCFTVLCDAVWSCVVLYGAVGCCAAGSGGQRWAAIRPTIHPSA